MKKILCYLPVLLLVALLSACGDSTHPSTAGGSLKAVIKPAALTAGLNVAGIKLAITMPPGVTVPLLADGITVDTNPPAPAIAPLEVVSSAPVEQKSLSGTYTAPTATSPGQLAIYVIEASGFTATDEITIHLTVAPGTFPVVGDFKLLSFEAFDINGAAVTGLNPTLTTTIQ